DAYSGYKANERPLKFDLDDRTYEIAAIEDRWQDPNAEYFKVRTVDGKRYLLRYGEGANESLRTRSMNVRALSEEQRSVRALSGALALYTLVRGFPFDVLRSAQPSNPSLNQTISALLASDYVEALGFAQWFVIPQQFVQLLHGNVRTSGLFLRVHDE